VSQLIAEGVDIVTISKRARVIFHEAANKIKVVLPVSSYWLRQLGYIAGDPAQHLSIIARDVSRVCKGLPEMVPATGSNCKSRDYRRVCYPNGSTPRMWGIGSPNTHCPVPH